MRLHPEGKPALAPSVPRLRVKVTISRLRSRSPRMLTVNSNSPLVPSGIVKLFQRSGIATLPESLEDSDSPIPPIGTVAVPVLPSPKLKRRTVDPMPSSRDDGLSEAKEITPLASPSLSMMESVKGIVSTTHPLAGKSVPSERLNFTSSMPSTILSSAIERSMVALLAPDGNVGPLPATTETSLPYVAASSKARLTEKSSGASAVRSSLTETVPASSLTEAEPNDSNTTMSGACRFKSWFAVRVLHVLLVPASVTLPRRKVTVLSILDILTA